VQGRAEVLSCATQADAVGEPLHRTAVAQSERLAELRSSTMKLVTDDGL